MAEPLAHAATDRGDLHLLRHDDGRIELRVNGVFVMDDHETTTERLLASYALDEHPGDATRVCIGGLGLGFTLREALNHPSVTHVDVVEIEAPLVAWHLDGTIATAHEALADRRTSLVTGDVCDHVRAAAPETYDLILLDVDNGPSYLVHEGNTRVYEPTFLAECRRALTPTGAVVVWSSSAEPALAAAIEAEYGECSTQAIPVQLGARETTYHLFTGRA